MFQLFVFVGLLVNDKNVFYELLQFTARPALLLLGVFVQRNCIEQSHKQLNVMNRCTRIEQLRSDGIAIEIETKMCRYSLLSVTLSVVVTITALHNLNQLF